MDNFLGNKHRQVVYYLILGVARHIFLNIVLDTLEVVVVSHGNIVNFKELG
jgi:hypothetical protein